MTPPVFFVQEIWVLWEIAGRMAGLPAGRHRPAGQVVSRSRQYLESAYTKFIRYGTY